MQNLKENLSGQDNTGIGGYEECNITIKLNYLGRNLFLHQKATSVEDEACDLL